MHQHTEGTIFEETVKHLLWIEHRNLGSQQSSKVMVSWILSITVLMFSEKGPTVQPFLDISHLESKQKQQRKSNWTDKHT